jgi:hypothetical protein
MQKHAFGRTLARRLLGAALLVAALPLAAHAQLGAFKRLKNKVSPDSATKAAAAAAHDSAATRDTASAKASGMAGLPTSPSGVKGAALARVGEKAAGVVGGGDSTSATTSKRSKLARVASKAVSASQKFEDVTGLSVKDAALIATGAGVGVVAAKKLGVDPTSMTTKAMARGSEKNAASQQASMAGMPNMAAMAGMPRSGGAAGAAGRSPQMAWPTADGRTMPAGAPYSEADVKMMQAFQEEMMRVSMAANRGDADAQARLQRLQEISARHEPEMERLSLRGTVADTAAVRRLVNIQVEIMREWMKDSPASAKAAAKVSKPAKAGRP